jgi:hypothetical protein
VRNYPDEISAREELGRYIETYNRMRLHQVLFDFTPAHVHPLNNKSTLLEQLKDLKRKTREKRNAYGAKKPNISQALIAEGCPSKGQCEILDSGENREAVLQPQPPDFHCESPTTKNTHLIPQFCLIEKNWTTFCEHLS